MDGDLRATRKRPAERPRPSEGHVGASKRQRLQHARDIVEWPLQKQAQFVWDLFAAVASDFLTDMELQGREFGDCVVSAPSHSGSLAVFAAACMRDPSLLRRKEQPKLGRPFVLVIASSGIRASHLARAMRSVGDQCIVGKLFAKHMKLEQQIKYLKEVRVRVGVGTPDRLHKLIDAGALSLADVDLVVLDTAVDVKERTIFEVPEVLKAWCMLLHEHLGARLASGATRLALYRGETVAGAQDAPAC